MPRGGVALGHVIAKATGAELDIITPRKLKDPYEPELAIGAVMPGVSAFLNDDVIAARGVYPQYIEEEMAREVEEASRRLRAYRGSRPYPELGGRIVMLVDDGIATGATMMVAARWARGQGAAKVMVAVPFIPKETIGSIERECDEVLYIAAPEFFMAIGQFYAEFLQVTDSEVVDTLKEYWRQKR